MSDKRPSPNPEIHFSYLKSEFFRVVHVDGAVGGITPTGLIHIAVYNERPAIPRSTVHTVDSEGRLSDKPISSEGREGIVREMEVDMLMSPEVAERFRDWLNKRLDEIAQHNARVGKAH